MGFGLWNYRALSFVVEMAVLIGGALLYLRIAARKTRVVVFVAFLAALQLLGTFFFPPPPSDRNEAVTALLFYFLLAAVAGWVERGQEQKRASAHHSSI